MKLTTLHLSFHTTLKNFIDSGKRMSSISDNETSGTHRKKNHLNSTNYRDLYSQSNRNKVGDIPIQVPSTSVFDLGIELALVKEKAKKDKSNLQTTNGRKISFKNQNEFNSGKDRKRRKTIEKDDPYQKSKEALKRKAKQYRKLEKNHSRANLDSNEESEGLVEFYRKKRPTSEDQESFGTESEFEESDEEMVEIVDEFGRTRVVSKSKVAYYKGEEYSKENSTLVEKPVELIHGDVIQSESFDIDKFKEPAKEIIDRDHNQDLEQHYDPNWEIRNRGVGFYAFSQNKEEYMKQMESLQNIREETMEELKRPKELRDCQISRIELRRAKILKLRQANLLHA